jgi:hypothetical protein
LWRIQYAADVHLIPQLWFRNTWSWGDDPRNAGILPPIRPTISLSNDSNSLVAKHQNLGTYRLYFEGDPGLLFCENRTNNVRLYGGEHDGETYKDGFHNAIINDDNNAAKNTEPATKSALHNRREVPVGETTSLTLRLKKGKSATPFERVDELLVA